MIKVDKSNSILLCSLGVSSGDGCSTTAEILGSLVREAVEDNLCGFCQVEMELLIDCEDDSEILCCPECDFVVGL